MSFLTAVTDNMYRWLIIPIAKAQLQSADLSSCADKVGRIHDSVPWAWQSGPAICDFRALVQLAG